MGISTGRMNSAILFATSVDVNCTDHSVGHPPPTQPLAGGITSGS